MTASLISCRLSHALFVIVLALANVSTAAIGASPTAAGDDYAYDLARIESRTETMLFLASAAGLTSSDKVRDPIWAETAIKALHRTAQNKWDADLTDTMLRLRGRMVAPQEPLDEALALATTLTNTMRKNGKGVTNLAVCMLADEPCDQTPFTEKELAVALGGGKPTASMTANRAYHLNGKGGVIFGFLSADTVSEQYAWRDTDGKPMTLEQTVQGMLQETSRDTIINKVKLCLQGSNDIDVETCARMGVRLRLTQAKITPATATDQAGIARIRLVHSYQVSTLISRETFIKCEGGLGTDPASAAEKYSNVEDGDKAFLRLAPLLSDKEVEDEHILARKYVNAVLAGCKYVR